MSVIDPNGNGKKLFPTRDLDNFEDIKLTTSVDCVFAAQTSRSNSVACKNELFGGYPHVAICKTCVKRKPSIPDIAPIIGPVGQNGMAQQNGDSNRSAIRVLQPSLREHKSAEHLVLKCNLSPGDVLMLTAAVRDLHKSYPGRFITSVQTSAPELWENSPWIIKDRLPETAGRIIEMQYPLIHHSNQRPVHFIQGYADYLSSVLGLQIPVTEFKGDIHLSAEEERWTNQVEEQFGYNGRFWILMAGGKYDFTAKWWPPASYQQVVDHFLGRVQFVQCGQSNHWHPPLRGVFDLIGRTSIRQFVRLMFHAEGVICPVTFAMHLAAAVPVKTNRIRPCVVIAGGREPAHWEAYPGHHFLHTIGCLPCCSTGGCWRSRCQKVGDGDSKDREGLCERPIQVDRDLVIPQCMMMVKSQDVISAVERAIAYAG